MTIRLLSALPAALLLCACGSSSDSRPAAGPPPEFRLEEATVADIHAAFAGRQTLTDGSPLSCV